MDKLVNPVVDPISGQPEFKHTPVSIQPYRPAWQGFLLNRDRVLPRYATYWAKAMRDGLWHYELRGEARAEDWSAVARELLSAASDATQWAELLYSAGGQYRGASAIDGCLQSCLCIGPDHRLPKRDWLVHLFSRANLSQQERLRLLAGVPEDAGKTVCACFSVGVNTLVRGIREQGLNTTEALGTTLQAGTNCGSCLTEIKSLIVQHVAETA